MITDYLFLFALLDESDADGELSTLILVSAASLGAAFVINLLLTAFVLLRQRRNPIFAKVCHGWLAACAV